MLASLEKKQAKPSRAGVSHQDAAARDGTAAPEPNSIWQSLALRPAAIQPKLNVSQPGDPYEQEADQVADQVTRMPEPQLQRACACGGGCPTCKTAQLNDEHVHVQTGRVRGSDGGQTATPAIVHEALGLPGQSLDPATRAPMESRFGHDFGHVRVHTDTKAAESARQVNALAYTVGRDVILGAGQYAPATDAGRRLIAHELTHVLQQSHSVSGNSKDSDVRSVDQTHPYIQRTSTAGQGESDLEAGAVGSVQFCVDFCSGDYRVVGWVWGGVGKRVWKTFIGPSFMYEGDLYNGNLPALKFFDCGTCDPDCKADKGLAGDSGIAGGIPFFRDIFKGKKDRATLKLAELECGFLLIPHSTCNIAVEFICFLNLIKYLGPLGRGLGTLAEQIGAEAKAGIDGGATIELCKDKQGNWVIPKAEVCLGGFIEFGWGIKLPSGKSKPPAGKGTPSPPKPPPSVPKPEPTPTTPMADPRLIS